MSCAQLDAARDALIAALGSYGPRLLGVYETPQRALLRAARIPLLRSTTARCARCCCRCRISAHYLPYRRVSFGQETVELGPAGRSPRSFVGLVSIKDYPGQTAPGMLDELLRLPFELTVLAELRLRRPPGGLGRMNLALRRMRSAEDEALSLRGELVQRQGRCRRRPRRPSASIT